jgi:hypothetical protein
MIREAPGRPTTVSAMAKKRNGDELRRHEKVVAATDMPGVPAGTRGKVTLVNGFAWIRYRVYFDNGADVGSLDRSQLVPEDDWKGAA